MSEPADPPFPYGLEREGVVMTPEPGDALEAEGVLNPGSGWGPDGELYLLPRLVAAGNVSRIGVARVEVVDGVPRSVHRLGVVLEPDLPWERGPDHAGVEDPRVTWLSALGVYVMTYVAFGPLGPRTALATSDDLRSWQRLGPVLFGYEDEVVADLNLYHNKDAVFFPEPVTAPDGRPSLAVLHRPMHELGMANLGTPTTPLAPDGRQSIWISFVPLEEARRDLHALALWHGHRFVTGPQYEFEALKIGGGPPPLRVPEGWLVLHHGVTGRLEPGVAQQQHAHYAAGGLLLHAERPWEVVGRSAEPLLAPERTEERRGVVPNVVFPTAIEQIEGRPYVFYGMADSRIGVARLVHRPDSE